MKTQYYSCFKIAIVIAISLLQTNAKAQQVLAAEIPTNYEVSSSGSFNYSVPLRIPPGIKDMVPHLSITYSSQSGNGNLGTGWSLNGVSSITRILPTIYHDQLLKPVDLISDNFALDGQRLYSLGSNTFNTWIKNFAKIQVFGAVSQGTSYFTVEYPNGMTYEYGNTSDSRMAAQGSRRTLTWAVNKISDRSGNYILFEYYNDANNGDYRISKISYTGNSNAPVTPPTAINFHYINRPDNNTSWIAGSVVKDNAVLDYVEVDQNSVMINKYVFSYNQNYYKTRLAKITEQRPGNVELPPININWGNEDLNYSTPNSSLGYASSNSNSGSDELLSLGDFNGDGATDYVVQSTDLNTQTSNYKMHLCDMANDDFGPAQTGTIPTSKDVAGFTSHSRNISVNYNGDNYDDLVTYTTNYLQSTNTYWLTINLSLSNGTTLATTPTDIFTYSYYGVNNALMVLNTKVIPGDFDGDGKKDILVLIPSSTALTSYDCFIVGDEFPSGPVNTQVGPTGYINYGNYRYVGSISHDIVVSMAIDYNGDGKDDLLTTSTSNGSADCEIFDIAFNYSAGVGNRVPGGTTSVMNAIYSAGYPSRYHTTIYPGDFNGDGKKDLLTWVSTGSSSGVGVWEIAYSTGAGGTNVNTAFSYRTVPSAMNPYGPTFNGIGGHAMWFGYFVADFDGDGKDDILQLDSSPGSINNGSPQFSMMYAIGNNNFHTETGYLTDFPAGGNNMSVGDFNADGQADLLWSNYISGSNTYPVIAYFHKNDKRNAVTSIEHAGKRLDIGYMSLSQMGYPDNYPAAGNGQFSMPFPFITRILPVKVVNRFNDNINVDNSYNYSTLITHLQGLGGLGFAKTTVIDNNAQKVIENIYNNTDGSPIPYVAKTSTWDLNTYNAIQANTIPGIPLNTPIYVKEQTMTDWVDQRFHNPVFSSTETDYSKGTYKQCYSIVSAFPSPAAGPASYMFNNYGQPDVEIIKDGPLTTETDFTYDLNAPFYNASKAVSITTIVTRDNKPAFTKIINTSYDNAGLIASTTSDMGTPNQKTTSYDYDFFGNVSFSQINAIGVTPNVTNSFLYSADGRFLTHDQNQLLYTNTYLYNTWGMQTRHVDIDGMTTRTIYDAVNRPVSAIEASGATHTKSYGWASNSGDNPGFQSAQFSVTTTTTGISGSKTTFYDYYGRQLRVAYPAFNSSTIYKDTKYKLNGLVDFTTMPYYATSTPAVTTTYSYDAMDRQTGSVTTSGPTITTAYNVLYGPMYIVSGLESVTTNTSTSPPQTKTKITDASEAVTRIVDNGNAIDYEYNSNGNPDGEKINYSSSFETQYTYDSYGRLKTKTHLNTGTTTYYYNALNQLTQETDANNTDIYYYYDELGRLIRKTNPDGQYTYAYDNTIPATSSTGKLIEQTSPYSTNFKYTYDAFGRRASFGQGTGGGVAYSNYTYDIYGRDSTIEYLSGDKILKNYNNYGFLESIDLTASQRGLPLQRLWKVNSKNELDLTTQTQLFDQVGNPILTFFKDYDNLGFPLERNVDRTFPTTVNNVVDFTYLFDHNTGNLSVRKDMTKGFGGFIESFGYDVYDRLTTVNYNINIPQITVNYSNEGNILSKSDITASTYNWKYTGYAVTCVPQPGLSTPAYVIPQAIQTVSYFPFRKVKEINELGEKAAFTYYPDDQRSLMTITQGSTGTFIKSRTYGENYESTLLPNSDREDIAYVMAGNELVAMLYHKMPKGSHSGTPATINEIYYPITDQLGSITHVFNSQGILIEEHSFDAWGRPRNPISYQYYSSSSTPPWRFERGYTGHEHIFDYNIINMNGRLYDPVIGRMYSPDPSLSDRTNSQAYNKYSYVNNNPLKYTDPDGKNPIVVALISAVVGGVVNCAAHHKDIDSWGKGIKYFGVGFVAGLVGGYAGAAAEGCAVGASSIVTAASMGAAAGAAGGFITGAGNSWIGGAGFGQSITAGMIGAGIGAIAGGICGAAFEGLREASRPIREGLYIRTHFSGRSVPFTKEYIDNFADDNFNSQMAKMHFNPDEHIKLVSLTEKHFVKNPGAVAITLPPGDDYTRIGIPDILLTKQACTSERMLYIVLQHEFIHGGDVYSGNVAFWYMIGGKNAKAFADNMSEINAYSQTLQTCQYLNESILYNDFNSSLQSAEAAVHISRVDFVTPIKK
jgi:RHS repeat-associated protein